MEHLSSTSWLFGAYTGEINETRMLCTYLTANSLHIRLPDFPASLQDAVRALRQHVADPSSAGVVSISRWHSGSKARDDGSLVDDEIYLAEWVLKASGDDVDLVSFEGGHDFGKLCDVQILEATEKFFGRGDVRSSMRVLLVPAEERFSRVFNVSMRNGIASVCAPRRLLNDLENMALSYGYFVRR